MTERTLPCSGRTTLYDLVLFDDDAQPTARDAARQEAAALCAACPAPCPDKVTADSGPRPLTLLPVDWMPPAVEGIPEPEPRVSSPRKWKRRTLPATGADYLPPERRVDGMAAMAAELAYQGRSVTQIADGLCVSEDTARALLSRTSFRSAAA